jgi:hypothetical protein
MIGNDSYLTGTDAVPLREAITQKSRVSVLSRTNCFEGKAINGAVVIWCRGEPNAEAIFHWVEAYKRDLRDFAGATLNCVSAGDTVNIGTMESIGATNAILSILPNRAFFRPSAEALDFVDCFADIVPEQFRTAEGWNLLARTPRLRKTIEAYTATGFYRRLTPGQFVPLGICIEGGQGLATADDRRFLAAIDDTDEGARTIRERDSLLNRIAQHPVAGPRFVRETKAGASEDDALLSLAEDEKLEEALRFPRLLKTVPRDEVYTGELKRTAIRDGLSGEKNYVQFEKGDRSGEDQAGASVAARWTRENPIVIDWSRTAVALIRARDAGAENRRRPRLQNEALWGRRGITWNSIARYLRARIVPDNSIFGHKTPVIVPTVEWLDEYALLALLNSDSVEFILKTFLGSLMQIEVGDLRRVPVPVLSQLQAKGLSELGSQATAAATERRSAELSEIERQINMFVRALYGIAEDVALWVTR